MAEFASDSSERLRIDALYARHGREIVARLYAHCCDRELALEAAQEAFLKLQGRSDAVLEPIAWLIQTGRNWIRDHIRRRRRFSDAAIDCDAIVAKAEGPLEAAMASETREKIAGALRQMSEEDRLALAMRFALDWPSARIAAAMGTTAAAVDMRISRAKNRLAGLLATMGVEGYVA